MRNGESGGGAPWLAGVLHASIDKHAAAPSRKSRDFCPARLVTTARSRHPGGVNVALCDGSARSFLAEITADQRSRPADRAEAPAR